MVAIQQQQLHLVTVFALDMSISDPDKIFYGKKKLQESLIYHKMLNYCINHYQVCHSESLIMLNK